jgi:hypothetical protein
MEGQVNSDCSDHGSSCVDKLIYYSDPLDEYGLTIFDGTDSYILISFCPWCGKKLPDSQRGRWFLELEKLGYEYPLEQVIPEDFKSATWRTRPQT